MTIPIVLLHAFPLSPDMWGHQRRSLKAAGFTVLTPHLLDPGKDYSRPAELGQLAKDVQDDVTAAGFKKFAVAGLSMGGYVALQLLESDPGRVVGIGLLDTKASSDDEATINSRKEYAARVRAEGMSWVPKATLPKLLGETTRAKRPAVTEQVREWILAADPVAVAWAQEAMANREDTLGALRVFRKPSVVVLGAEDVISPMSEAMAMSHALGGVPLGEIPGAGHLSAVECPKRVSEMLVSWAQRCLRVN